MSNFRIYRRIISSMETKNIDKPSKRSLIFRSNYLHILLPKINRKELEDVLNFFSKGQARKLQPKGSHVFKDGDLKECSEESQFLKTPKGFYICL